MIRLQEAINKKTIDKNGESDKLEADEHLKKIVKILYRARIKEAFNIIENFEVDEDNLILINNSINLIRKSELKKFHMNRTYEDIEASVYKFPRKKLDNKYTNYIKNFKNFYNKLGRLSISDLNTFCLYILEHSEVIEIRSWNIEQAITMFNLSNSDCVPLSDADITSAKLFANVSEDDKEFSEK